MPLDSELGMMKAKTLQEVFVCTNVCAVLRMNSDVNVES